MSQPDDSAFMGGTEAERRAVARIRSAGAVLHEVRKHGGLWAVSATYDGDRLGVSRRDRERALDSLASLVEARKP